MDQKKKPARIRWTTAWRRNNKKTEVMRDVRLFIVGC